jgi:succinyl-diaminopimelate desuccinylase
MAVLYALSFFKENNIRLNHTVFQFLGANEESGMKDVAHFLEVDTPPLLSIIADTSFPVCNGEKGIFTAEFTTGIPAGNLLKFDGGRASNIVPDNAEAVITGFTAADVKAKLGREFSVETGKKNTVKIAATGISGHTAYPEGTINALQKLADALVKAKLADSKAKPALAFIADSFRDYYGKGLDIDFKDDVSGKTTHTGSTARTAGGLLTVGINVRYAISAPLDELAGRVIRRALKYGYTLLNAANNAPRYTPADDPVVQKLNNIVNEELGTDNAPYVMPGGTHARKLPNSLGFGAGRRDLDPPFGPHKGRGHQVDEAADIQQLQDAVRIYVRALLELDSGPIHS